MSPCIVPIYNGIYFVWLKYSPINMVLECEYMLPINLNVYYGYPKSFMMGLLFVYFNCYILWVCEYIIIEVSDAV